MSKELEALEKLKATTKFDGGLNYSFGDCHIKEFKIIENALKRLEEYDDLIKEYDIKPAEIREAFIFYKMNQNTNSSETLKSLEFICKILKEKGIDIKWLFKEQYNTIKQALIKAQENENVLEIIKKKDVDVRDLKAYFKVERGLQEYNKHQYKENELTQEEFNTLKRHFGNE